MAGAGEGGVWRGRGQGRGATARATKTTAPRSMVLFSAAAARAVPCATAVAARCGSSGGRACGGGGNGGGNKRGDGNHTSSSTLPRTHTIPPSSCSHLCPTLSLSASSCPCPCLPPCKNRTPHQRQPQSAHRTPTASAHCAANVMASARPSPRLTLTLSSSVGCICLFCFLCFPWCRVFQVVRAMTKRSGVHSCGPSRSRGTVNKAKCSCRVGPEWASGMSPAASYGSWLMFLLVFALACPPHSPFSFSPGTPSAVASMGTGTGT